jgi:transposase
MDTVFNKVAGLDVHQRFITVGVRCHLDTGKLFAEVRTFGTMTKDLLALADYLEAFGVTHVALESTGVLWKPVWNILEGRFTLLLVNPRHIKQVPGRKTDVNDAQWIAQLLQCGLLRSSFVPPRELRDLRDLTRFRAQLASEPTRLANRIHKVLEDANIKLGAVASDILGKSGRAMLRALIRGERDPAKLADLAAGRLRGKIPELKLTLEGHFTDHHRFLVEHLLLHLDELERHVEEISSRIAERFRPLLSEARLKCLDAIPGVNGTTIENVIAEIGVDMSVYSDEHHLCS